MKNRARLQKNTLMVLTLLFVPLFTFAQEAPRLDVEFTPNPLFSEQNILPGDSVSGVVTISNNSGETQEVIVEATNVSDPEGLSAQMELVITNQDDVILYDQSFGTFFDFLTGGVFMLTNSLLDESSEEYTFAVSLISDSDNMYQLTELGFDLCVGFKDELSGTNCGDTVVSSEGNTGGDTDTIVDDAGTIVGGSGGGINPNTPALQIFDEEVESIDDILGTAVITWDTNLYSTSQVVYGLASDGPFSLSAIDATFGYTNATVEDTTKVLQHSVLLTGLIPGETYNFRVVSRASPPTVSYEYSFVVAKHLSEDPSTGEVSDNPTLIPTNTTVGVSASNSTQIQQTPTIATPTMTATGTLEDNTQPIVQTLSTQNKGTTDDGLTSAPEGFAAAAFLSGIFSGDYECLSYTALALLIVAALYGVWSRVMTRHSNVHKRRLAVYISIILTTLLILALQVLCVIPALLVLLIIIVSINVYRGKITVSTEIGGEEKILHKKEIV